VKKLIAALAPLTLMAAVCASGDAGANQPLTPINVPIFFGTIVTGTVTVPGAQSGPLAGLDNCNQVVIGATSTKLNGFVPQWTRTTNATGTYSTGKCTYSMYVPGNSAFVLSANGHGNVIPGFTTPTNVGPITVPALTTKTVDFKIDSFQCEVIK